MGVVASRRGLLALAGVVVAVAGALALSGVVAVGAEPRGDPKVGPDVPVTAMNLGAGFANNSAEIVADPTEEDFVVMAHRLDAPDFGCALEVSGDGGRTWLPAQPVTEAPEGTDKCYAGEAAFDGQGALHFLFVGLEGRGNLPVGAFISTSTDRAKTFSAPRRVLGPLRFGVRMAIDRSVGDRGRLHLVWLEARGDPPTGGLPSPPNPIMAMYSDDGGSTFSEPVQVSDPDRALVVAPALALGPGGTVHVGYYDLGDDERDYRGLEGPTWPGTWSAVVSSSTDRGSTFRGGVAVDGAIVPDERVLLVLTMPPPALAAGEDGRLCLAWTDARNGDADAVLRCSADGGASWGDLRRLNDDPVGNGRTQYQPALDLAPSGRLDAVFYDRRDDDENVRNEVSYTYSTDGGTSFAPNLTLTSGRSSSLVGQQYAIPSAQGLVEFGSRMGLMSSDEGALAAWTDTRNSRGGTSQDLFSAIVRHPRSRPLWPRAAGALVLVAGLAALAVAAAPKRGSHRAGEDGP